MTQEFARISSPAGAVLLLHSPARGQDDRRWSPDHKFDAMAESGQKCVSDVNANAS
jgi:hypothetical protein